MRKHNLFIILIALCQFVLLLSCLYARTIKEDKEDNPNPIKLTVDSVGDVGEYTSLAVDGDNVYIFYRDNTNDDLKFAKSTDKGNTWPVASIKTIDSAGNVGSYTSLAVAGSNVYISYHDNTNGDLKFAKSVDGGNTWAP